MHCSPYLEISIAAGREEDDVEFIIAWYLHGVQRSLVAELPQFMWRQAWITRLPTDKSPQTIIIL